VERKTTEGLCTVDIYTFVKTTNTDQEREGNKLQQMVEGGVVSGWFCHHCAFPLPSQHFSPFTKEDNQFCANTDNKDLRGGGEKRFFSTESRSFSTAQCSLHLAGDAFHTNAMTRKRHL
jgi:hypothetical protein